MSKKIPKELHKPKGRPSVWSDRLRDIILALAREGKTDNEIADICNINQATLNVWKSKYPDFYESLKEAKDIPDQLVEAALFRRAIGYSHKAVKMFCDKGQIVSEEYIQIYPPDTVAAIFWLKNRQPERWRDQQNVVHDVDESLAEKLTKAIARSESDD